MAASDPSLCKTSLGETGCLGNPYFTYWLPKHPVFSFTLAQSVRLPMVTYLSLYSSCVTYGTLCHTTGHQVLPTPAFSVTPHPSTSYRQVFRPTLYFQPSSMQSDSQLCLSPCLGKLLLAIILSMCLCPHT